VDPPARLVAILNYDEVDQFDRLAIRQVAINQWGGERLE
jgi:hypothetical protein